MYKGPERRIKKPNTVWLVGLVVSIVMAVCSMAFGAIQTANAQTHGQIIDRVELNEKKTDETNIIVAVIATKMDAMINEMKEVKEILKRGH